MPFAIPFWLKIAAPIVALLLVIAAVVSWGNSKYRAGEKAGVAATDAKWEAASAKLKEAAAASATKADDAAVKRFEEHVADATETAARVEKAKAEGSSPLDAIFGN